MLRPSTFSAVATMGFAAVLATPAGKAAAPMALGDNPGFYRMTLGDFQVTALSERAAKEHLRVGAAHIAFPGLGHVSRDGNQYRWIPADYETAADGAH